MSNAIARLFEYAGITKEEDQSEAAKEIVPLLERKYDNSRDYACPSHGWSGSGRAWRCQSFEGHTGPHYITNGGMILAAYWVQGSPEVEWEEARATYKQRADR